MDTHGRRVFCFMVECFRLFPSHDRLVAHRKTAHDTNDDDREHIITWNG